MGTEMFPRDGDENLGLEGQIEDIKRCIGWGLVGWYLLLILDIE